MVEDLLNGEVARERTRELHQNRRQPLLIHHPSHQRTRKYVRHQGPGRPCTMRASVYAERLPPGGVSATPQMPMPRRLPR